MSAVRAVTVARNPRNATVRAVPSDGRSASQEHELALLIESVLDYAIFLLDADGVVRTWNRGAQRIKGYSADEIIGQRFVAFYTPEDRERGHPQDVLAAARRDGRYEEEGWRVRRDGTRFWASVTITAVYDDEGRVTGFAKVTRDLTSRREAEERLRAANRELDRFASIAAHDLSDPLHTILGFAGLLEREDLSAEGREFLTHLQTTAGRMQRLLETLLDYARAGGGGQAARPVPIRPAVEAAVGDLAATVRHRAARVEVVVPDGACVLADESDLELVLRNLIANGLKFGPPEGAQVSVIAAPAGDRWRIEVADNGVGIRADDLERIFGAFERSGSAAGVEGSGLGLAICERLVRRHGGSIAVASEPGQGSRFWVLLPSPDATA